MFEEGVAEEIRALDREPSTTAVKAIGFREIREFNEGRMSREDCIARIQQVTRRYAKRQETWFKKETGFRVIPCQPDDDSDSIADRILDIFPLSQLRSLRDNPPCPIS
jgi:tRNA A37 N6-isopentenylltransferase MiaA